MLGQVDISEPAVEIGRGQWRLGATVNWQKLAWIALIAFLIFFVINSPTDAADIVKSAQHAISHGFNSMATFLKSF